MPGLWPVSRKPTNVSVRQYPPDSTGDEQVSECFGLTQELFGRLALDVFLVCGNGNLTGTMLGVATVDATTAGIMASVSQRWCTPYDIPNPQAPVPGPYTQQYFARMWYDLLLLSDSFLGLVQGQSNPYTWTTGAGCGYTLRGSRAIYSNQSDEAILLGASDILYNIDEGASIGPVDRNCT